MTANRLGLDTSFLREKLQYILSNMDAYCPSEMRQELHQLADAQELEPVDEMILDRPEGG